MKVSVAMITYNHEHYVAQAVESALMQEADFEYEIVVGEDCSTDRTRAIVLDLQQKYPDRIRLLLHEQNLGMLANFAATLHACRGEYVALLEGDDYWTSPHKLQKQVAFLESHPECALCFHNVTMVREDGNQALGTYCAEDQKEISTIEDILMSCFICTPSVMFRHEAGRHLPAWFFSLGMGDWPFFILAAHRGPLGYIDEVMAAYRIHPAGVWSSKDPDQWFRAVHHMYDAVNVHLDRTYSDVVNQGKLEHACICLAEQAKRAGSMHAGIALARQTFAAWHTDLGLPEDWQGKAMGRVYAHYLFANYAGHDMAAMRRSFVGMVRHDPSWLRNRGVWSIGVEAFLGQRAAGLLRGPARGVLGARHGSSPPWQAPGEISRRMGS